MEDFCEEPLATIEIWWISIRQARTNSCLSVSLQWPDTSTQLQEALAAFKGGLLSLRAATSAAATAVQQVGGNTSC
jgi:hypothetical protein